MSDTLDEEFFEKLIKQHPSDILPNALLDIVRSLKRTRDEIALIKSGKAGKTGWYADLKGDRLRAAEQRLASTAREYEALVRVLFPESDDNSEK